MHARDLVQYVLRALWAHRLRSLLTGLGMLIGVAAVILLTAIGSGTRAHVLGEFTQFGAHLIAITPGKHATLGLSGASINSVRPLSLADAEAIARQMRVLAATPLVQGNAEAEGTGRKRRINLFGVGSAMPRVWSSRMALGQFLPDDDIHTPRSYAVLGARVHRELFDATNPLGQSLRIGGSRFRIVGVLESKGEMLGFDLDDTVFIPAAKAMELFNRDSLMEIDVLHAPDVSSASMVNALRAALTQRHGREDFTVVTQEEMLDSLGSVLNILTLVVGALGGISLIVGAVGIFTILTISVTERTAEIGLLGALGAERGGILRIFLLEATLLGVGGGLAGVITGAVLVWGLGEILPALPLRIEPAFAAMALCISVAVGLLSGVLPARRAALLEPQNALRAE